MDNKFTPAMLPALLMEFEVQRYKQDGSIETITVIAHTIEPFDEMGDGLVFYRLSESPVINEIGARKIPVRLVRNWFDVQVIEGRTVN